MTETETQSTNPADEIEYTDVSDADTEPDDEYFEEIVSEDNADETGPHAAETDNGNSEPGDEDAASDETPTEKEPEPEPAPPTTESISFHIHRDLNTGRTTIAAKGSSTDPYYRTIDRMDSLEEAMPLLAELHQEARAHWESSPRYPDFKNAPKETPRPRPQPQSKTPSKSTGADANKQASLF